MKILRYLRGREFGFGLLEDDEILPIEDPFRSDNELLPHITVDATGEPAFPLSEARLIAPCSPSKIVCIGVNYAAHAKEMGKTPPAEPLIFLKAPSAIIGPGSTIVRPPESTRVDHEAELGVVIGRVCRRVPAEAFGHVVLGYTCVNDVTARDLQSRDVQFSRAKSFDTFCPIGPWIVTDLDPGDLAVEARVNGERRQSARTSDLIHTVGRLVAHVSNVMTLFPGDVIATGTPSGVGPLVAGDEVTVSVEGIGDLTNAVADEA